MAFSVTETTIYLRDHCLIEEAEALYDAVRAMERPVFDLSEARYMHSAIIQLIIASCGKVRPAPTDPVLAACFSNLVQA